MISVVNNKHNIFMRMIRDLTKNKMLYILSLPGIAYFLIFCYWPMAGLVVVFKQYNFHLGIWASDWIGLDNFKFLFLNSDQVRTAVINTLFLNIVFISTGTCLAVLTALLLNEINSLLFKKVTQSMVILPNFISWVVVSVLAINLFKQDGGLVNNILLSTGLTPIKWNERADLWRYLLILFSAWKSVGFTSVIYLAAITGINPEMYEHCKLEGANKLQQIRFVTLPLISPIISILVLLAVGRIFYGDFGMIYGLIRDNALLFPTTDVIDTYVFRALRQLNDIGMSSAAGFCQSIIGFILVLASNLIVKKYSPESALF